MSNSIRLGLIDDHPVVREGLRTFFEAAQDIVIAFESATGEDALTELDHTACDVVLLDLVLLDGMDGVLTFEAIRSRFPGIKVIILTSYRDPHQLTYLRNQGAAGYLDKTVQPDDLLRAVQWIYQGHSVWDSPTNASPHSIESLTGRERAVLEQMATGLSNKEIATRLVISEKTVKVHVSHILGKLAVYDRTQAVIVAHQLGLVRFGGTNP